MSGANVGQFNNGYFMLQLVSMLLLILSPTLTNSADLTYFINEEQPKDTWVGSVADDYNPRAFITSDQYENLIYKILSIGNAFASYFRVVNTTGQLYTTGPIDRDDISHCELVENCTVSLAMAVQSTIGAFFRKIDVEVVIGDLNDNSPVFDNRFESVEFSEDSARKSAETISGATDRDKGNNTVKRYYILTPDVPFDVEWEDYVNGRSVVSLVVQGELDREKKDFYQLKVVAEDGGDPVRTGTVDVDITILDENDNTPVFDRPFYNITIKEDLDPNTVVENITATDKDIGENGEIVYSLSENQPIDNVFNSFAINSTTGALSVIGEIDYVPNEQMRIYVEASDRGTKPKIALAVVYLNILDSTNKPPVINVNILSGEFVARVSEYANVGAVVAHIGVIDDDTGRNGKVDCIGVNEFDAFALERLQIKEYKAVVAQALDREVLDRHELTIVCRDNGSPPLNSSFTFTVFIQDENDNAPRFLLNNHFAKAEENNQVGDVVAKVIAFDIDTGVNSEIEYSIVNDAGYNFWMDPGTGEIRANFKLDRENVTQITLTVMAMDKGSPRLSAQSTVILTVADQNDNHPVFSQPNGYEFFVYEGVAFNTTVDQLKATDNDYGNNAAVSFAFDTLPSASFPFTLYTDGTIKMIRGLDRETQDRYIFNVIASDQGTPSLSSTATVTVIVLDVNDNAPVFVFPVDTNNTATIPFSNSPDSVTIVITATDRDELANGRVEYSILDKNLTSLFSMESRDGHGYIKLLRFPASSEPLTYTFRIKAEDMGQMRQSSVQTLKIVFTKEEEESNKQNFLIAIALGCVTVVLSIAIVLTIFLIRRHDRLGKRNCSDCSDKMDLEVVPPESKTRVDLSSVTSGSKESLKKVSFSTDYNSTLDSDNSKDMPQAPLVNQESFKIIQNGRVTSSSPSPRTYIQHPSDTDLQKLDPAKALQLHRSLLQSHDQLWTNHRDGHTPPLTKDILKHHEDNGSESSGETATYDSGRGGSESDIQTSYSQSHDPDHIKTVTFANKPVLHHFPPNNRWGDTTSSLHSPYDNSVSHNNFHKNNISPTRREVIPGSSSHHRPHKHDHNLSPIQDIQNHSMSYQDDDDDTTTSGSYTIDNDDWLNDSHGQSRPYTLSHNEAYC